MSLPRLCGPTIRAAWQGTGSHLTSLAKDSVQCAALVEAHLLRPFWASVIVTKAAVRVDVSAYSTMPVFFWREALRHVCEKMLGAGALRPRTAQPRLAPNLDPPQPRPAPP